jgi:hypothetical protein
VMLQDHLQSWWPPTWSNLQQPTESRSVC